MRKLPRCTVEASIPVSIAMSSIQRTAGGLPSAELWVERQTGKRRLGVDATTLRAGQAAVAGDVPGLTSGDADRPRSVVESLVEQPGEGALGTRIRRVPDRRQAAQRDRDLERHHRISGLALCPAEGRERERAVGRLASEDSFGDRGDAGLGAVQAEVRDAA